jgi:DNA repair ATPase RecN
MPRTNGVKTETSAQDLPTESDVQDPEEIAEKPESVEDVQDIDSILNSLKSLLSTVEKLQKIRQEVGDIKPLIGRMLDGEIVAGEELEQLKSGVSGLSRLIRAYSDHQAALAKAQPARDLLDQVLKTKTAD